MTDDSLQRSIDEMRKDIHKIKRTLDSELGYTDERGTSPGNINYNLSQVRMDVQQMRAAVCGPDNHPESGLIVRVHDLEASESRRVWATRTGLAAALTALFAVLAQWFQGR